MHEGVCVSDAARGASLLATPAEPLPKLDAMRPLPGAEMLAQRVNGMAVLYPAARRVKHPFPQMEEKYAKFCLLLAVCVQRRAQPAHMEEARAGFGAELPVPRAYLRQGCAESWEITENGTRAVWSAAARRTGRDRAAVGGKGGHLRRHTVTSEITCEAFDAGFAVPDDCPGAAHSCTATAAARNTPEASVR